MKGWDSKGLWLKAKSFADKAHSFDHASADLYIHQKFWTDRAGHRQPYFNGHVQPDPHLFLMEKIQAIPFHDGNDLYFNSGIGLLRDLLFRLPQSPWLCRTHPSQPDFHCAL